MSVLIPFNEPGKKAEKTGIRQLAETSQADRGKKGARSIETARHDAAHQNSCLTERRRERLKAKNTREKPERGNLKKSMHACGRHDGLKSNCQTTPKKGLQKTQQELEE